MSTWHQEREGHPLPTLAHPTQWRSYNPKGHLSVMTFATMNDCTKYCEKTGDIPVPPHSPNRQNLSDDMAPVRDTAQHLKQLGIAICCDIADEIDSGWYGFVCESGMPDEQFISELAEKLDSVDGFDLKGRFPTESHRQRQQG